MILLALSGMPVQAAEHPVNEAIEQIYSSKDIQRDLPLGQPEKAESSVPDERSSWTLGIGGNIAAWFLYGALAIFLAAALYSARDSLPRLGRKRLVADAKVLEEQAASVERMTETRIEADELAIQGRYAEAMHALLLRSLHELRRMRVTIADSLTSREILRAVKLPGAGNASFAEMIGRVELVHFGERPASQDDYFDCRARYEVLAASIAEALAA